MDISQLHIGDKAKVVRFRSEEQASRQKLLAMGIVPGAEISLVRVAPLGSPLVLAVCGAQYSVRHNELLDLQIEKIV